MSPHITKNFKTRSLARSPATVREHDGTILDEVRATIGNFVTRRQAELGKPLPALQNSGDAVVKIGIVEIYACDVSKKQLATGLERDNGPPVEDFATVTKQS